MSDNKVKTTPATSSTAFLDAIIESKEAHSDADDRLNRVMEQRGWNYKCDTPGSVWMWQKTLFDGRTVLVDRDTAIRLETELCGEYYPE